MTGMELLGFAVAIAVAASVAGVLAGLFGIGGGAVLVPVFFQLFGILGVDDAIRMHLAVGTSLAIIAPTSVRSFLSHRKKGTVDEALLKTYIVAVPSGVVIASLVAANVTSTVLQAIFGVITLLVAFKLLFGKKEWTLGPEIPAQPVPSVLGFGIGFLSTLMGIGGGVLNNTFMTLFSRPIHQAVSTSAGVGVLIAIPGLFGYIWAGWGREGLLDFSTGFVNWAVVALTIPITLLLAPVGVKLAHQLSREKLERGFGIFMLLVGIRFMVALFG